MPNLSGAVVALEAALREVASWSSHPSVAATNRTRAAVWALVDELKAFGEPPERVIAFVKGVFRDAGFSPSQDAIAGNVVPWCIARYYAGDDARVPPSVKRDERPTDGRVRDAREVTDSPCGHSQISE
jgi:hypothetical protein